MHVHSTLSSIIFKYTFWFDYVFFFINFLMLLLFSPLFFLLLCSHFTQNLLLMTQQKPIENQIKRRKWNSIRHTLRKEVGATEKTALDWNLQGYRRRGRPKRKWRKKIEDEIRGTGRSWNEVTGIAGDRNAWKFFMDALCSTTSKRT
jgi:hypothetical protein